MTHDELMAKVNKEVEMAEFEDACGDGNNPSVAKALRAVVELHKPARCIQDCCDICKHCYGDDDRADIYPCPTIKAIEKELY